MIEDADPLHQLEGRERVRAHAGGYPFRRIVVPQNDLRIVWVEPGLQEAIPAQIDVRVQKQPYQLCIKRCEYFPPIRCAGGPVLGTT